MADVRGRNSGILLQQQSVAVRREKVQARRLPEIAPGIYQWTGNYDPFLGYMSGVLETEELQDKAVFL